MVTSSGVDAVDDLGVEVMAEPEDHPEHPGPGPPEPAGPTVGLVAELLGRRQDVSARVLRGPGHLT